MSSPSRTVLVTGCSSGIGRATAELLVEQGFRVFAGVRSSEQGAELAKQDLIALQLDVTKESDILAAVKAVREASPGGLYALVNNAGMGLASAVELTSPDELRGIFEVNTLGPLRMIQHCLPLLRQGQGRIVNVSSMNGTMALPMVGGYSASKFALEALSDTLRVELRPWRVTVSLIRPGQVRTPIFIKARDQIEQRRGEIPAELRDGYDAMYAKCAKFNERGLKSRTSPEAVARVVLWALQARSPRTHYQVGWDAFGMSLAKYLPPWIVDRALARAMKMYRRVVGG